MSLSLEQVLALAPDASSAAAGKKLGTPAPWQNLGGNDDAYWGECKGSALYQVRVARADLTAKCSCPSRKFPCKHALGLLVPAATAPQALRATEPPEWWVLASSRRRMWRRRCTSSSTRACLPANSRGLRSNAVRGRSGRAPSRRRAAGETMTLRAGAVARSDEALRQSNTAAISSMPM